MSEGTKSLREYILVLRRRKWWFLVPTVLVLGASATIAWVWPPTYRSEATILVEQAEIPENLVDTVIDDYVERRLEAISRRILVTDNLRRIIEQYNLFPEERANRPIAAVIEDMRQDIHREMISTEVVNPSSGSRSQSTVAFQVMFDHRQPEVAQRVNNELVSLYLNANLRLRRERASETANFIRDERERAEERISKLSQEMAEFKRANSGSLPEDQSYTQQQIAQINQELGSLERQARHLTERKIYLEAQLSTLDPNASADGSGPGARLRTLQAELATKRGRYGSEHPDVVKLAREVRGLKELVGETSSGTDALRREQTRLQQELETLRGQYTTDHPDVRRAEDELQRLEAELRSARGNDAGASGSSNPAYVELDAELNAVRSELAAIERQRKALGERLTELQAQLAKAPMVEREFGRLRRALDDANALRDELSRKEAIARLGQSLETEQKGERFSLIEPPSAPADPVKPDRLAVMLIGLVLAIGAGLGMVVTAEALDDAVHSPRDLNHMFGEAPLAVIPRIVTTADRSRTWAVRAAMAVVVLTAGGLLAWWVHTYHLPLDIAWYRWQRTALTTVQSYVSQPVAAPAASTEDR